MPFISIRSIATDTIHTLTTCYAGVWHRAYLPGSDAIEGRVTRQQAMKLLDDWSADVDAHDADLLHMDSDAFTAFVRG